MTIRSNGSEQVSPSAGAPATVLQPQLAVRAGTDQLQGIAGVARWRRRVTHESGQDVDKECIEFLAVSPR